MFFRKKKTDENAQPKEKTPYEKAVSWEVSRTELLEKSEAKAWGTVKLFGAVIALEALALVFLMPLKSVEPFVIKVDQSSGQTEVLSIADKQNIPVSEMMDKYWLNQYVLSRETYDWHTLENDFIRVRELSTPQVFEPYGRQFGTHKESLESKLVDKKKILTKVLSVVPNGNGIATVRFTKTLIDAQSNMEEAHNSWTATIGYEYCPDFELAEPKRLINPFGFKVTSYRVDPELEGGGL